MRDREDQEEPALPERRTQGAGNSIVRLPSRAPLPPTSNRLLAALPDDEYLRLAPHFECVPLSRGMVLAEYGQPLTHAYFPTEGLVSVLANLSDGAATEIATVGNEGMISVAIVLEGIGASGPLRRSVVHIPGHGYQLRADILMQEFELAGKLQHWLLRYTQALITQVAQIAMCNRCHGMEAQLCRWLLQRFDRLAVTELYTTQQEVADLLGVRREAVNEAACVLQEAGLIRYGRGHVVLLDRAGLKKRGCECLGVIQKEYARLLGV